MRSGSTDGESIAVTSVGSGRGGRRSVASCPDCGQDTWDVQRRVCSACGYDVPAARLADTLLKVTPDVTPITKFVTEVTPSVTEPCPTCGCTGHVAKSGAERQKAWRARRNEHHDS